jgi:hypothetical protein
MGDKGPVGPLSFFMASAKKARAVCGGLGVLIFHRAQAKFLREADISDLSVFIY